MKKILSIFLAAALLICLASCSKQPTNPENPDEDDNNNGYSVEDGNASFKYEITTLNTIRITGYSGKCPWKKGSFAVTFL